MRADQQRRAWRRTAWVWFIGVMMAVAGLRAAESPPNILLILADDLGYEGLSANGSQTYRTPRLDRLARDGARFTHCYSQPLCTPTRVQIMTGRYAFRNYVRFGTLAHGEKTFAHAARQAGYATVVAGKWQLGDGAGEGQSPAQAGFDAFCLWNIRLDGLQAKGPRYADPNLVYLDRQSGKPKAATMKGRYGPDVCVDYLVDFIRDSVERNKPFLAYYPMILPHGPFQPTPDSQGWSGNRHAKRPAYFKDMVAYMDKLVGRLDDELARLKVRTNTLVLFVGDNGSPNGMASVMAGQRKVSGAKGHARDGGTRVPLVVSWPGTVRAGQVRSELVDVSDFLPTLAEAMRAKPLKPPGDGLLDGRSFLPLLLGRDYRPRDWILVDYTEPRQDRFPWPRARFVRNQQYKLYGFYELKPKKGKQPTIVKTGQFFDVRNDPLETRPLAADTLKGDASRAHAAFQEVLQSLPAVPEP